MGTQACASAKVRTSHRLIHPEIHDFSHLFMRARQRAICNRNELPNARTASLTAVEIMVLAGRQDTASPQTVQVIASKLQQNAKGSV